MGIRKHALNNKAFMQLKNSYDNRKEAAKSWKEQGKKVVGILGADVPDELLLAADMMAYPIYGEPDRELTEADAYLEFSFPLTVRAQFEKILDGADCDIMDYLVISNSTDALVRIYYYIRELKQLEPEKPIPELYFIDWLFTKYRMHQLRNETIIEAFRKKLSEWSGKELTDESIRAASVLCNKNRAALGRVGELRKQGNIAGSEALVIIGAGLYMEKETHTELVEELAEDAKTWPEIKEAPLFVTGSTQDHSAFYELIEACGGNVVSEDHDFGDRYWKRQTDVELAPIKGIVDRYMLREAGTKRAFVSERVEAVCCAAQKCGAKGVISYTYKYDDATSWDFPEQSKALEQMSMKALQLSGQAYGAEEAGETEHILKRFINQIKGA